MNVIGTINVHPTVYVNLTSLVKWIREIPSDFMVAHGTSVFNDMLAYVRNSPIVEEVKEMVGLSDEQLKEAVLTITTRDNLSYYVVVFYDGITSHMKLGTEVEANAWYAVSSQGVEAGPFKAYCTAKAYCEEHGWTPMHSDAVVIVFFDEES